MTDAGFPGADRFAGVAGQLGQDRAGARVQSTRDHDAIRRWAATHEAEPATGQATASGPATIVVNDGGAGLRFNFPAVSRFRPIAWSEWLDHFDAHQLLFVYEEQDVAQVAIRAHELFRARGGQDGADRDDWMRAEQDVQMRAGGASPSLRYRFVKDPAGL